MTKGRLAFSEVSRIRFRGALTSARDVDVITRFDNIVLESGQWDVMSMRDGKRVQLLFKTFSCFVYFSFPRCRKFTRGRVETAATAATGAPIFFFLAPEGSTRTRSGMMKESAIGM